MKNIRNAIFIFFALLIYSVSYSQISDIQKIKDRYKIAEELFKHEIRLNTMQAAIGEQNTNILFYYMSEQIDAEEDQQFGIKKKAIK